MTSNHEVVTDQDWLAARFETHRGHLRGVAYRMLGSLTEADDAVQEAWLRLSRTDTDDGGPTRPDLVSLLRGAEAVATGAMAFRQFAATATRALVNGIPGGIAWTPDGRPFAVVSVTVVGGRIVSIDILADPDRLRRLELDLLAD